MPYTYSDNTSYSSQSYTFLATITGYNGVTKVATLDTGVAVSLGYNGSVGDITSQYSISGTAPSLSAAKLTNTVPALSTDESGNFSGVFGIPAGVFQTGRRIFRVDNRFIYTRPSSATTYAQSTFFAGNLSDKTTASEFSPSFDSSSTSFTQSSQQSSQLTTSLSAYTPNDPVAQTFEISSDNFPNGAFISSLKLFFAGKPSTSVPITVSIVGTLNGYPTGTVLDHSTVTLDSSQVITSQNPQYLDSTTYTEFMFPAPVYIRPGTLYAILVQSSSPDYEMYIARQGNIAVPSSAKALPTDTNPAHPTKIGTIPYIGNIFESQNSITWVADQTADLMFVIDRCVFNTQIKNNSIPFQLSKNALARKLSGKEIQYKLDSNTVPSAYGSILLPLNSHEYNVTTTDFVPSGTNLSYTYQSLYDVGGVKTLSSAVSVNPGKYGCPTPDNISLNDGNGVRTIDPFRTSSFTLYANMSTNNDAVSPIISDDGVTLYSIRYMINDMGIGNNVISVTNGGAGYNANTTYATISSSDYGTAPTLGVTVANGVVTNVYTQTNLPGSGYIKTPTITIVDANTTPGNGATVVVAGETSPSGGNGSARYITNVVTLTPQNISGDLRVFFSAYYPVNTNILVYYKILNPNDTQQFNNGNWQLMTQITNVNSFSSKNTDLMDYSFAPGINNAANNSISYISANGKTYNSFNQYAIKIVLATSDKTVIPYLSNLRIIALPSGTGI
jgi:hypothetical protein